MIGASNKNNIYYSTKDDCIFLTQASDKGGKKDGEDSRGRVRATMKDVDSDLNIYYCKKDNDLAEKTLLNLQTEDGADLNSLATDPLFVDPENGDFRLKPDSPALKMGFIQFDVTKVGLRREQEVKLIIGK